MSEAMSEVVSEATSEKKESHSLMFEHDENQEGWCSLCKAASPRGVLVRKIEVTGSVPQADPSFDKKTDEVRLAGEFHYRIGACCIGRMVTSLEKKE